MKRLILTSIAVAIIGLGGNATADDGASAGSCLTPVEARHAVAEGRAMSLSEVKRGVRGDVLRARLCRRDGRLAYALTVLQRDGQVVALVLDARDGDVAAEVVRGSVEGR